MVMGAIMAVGWFFLGHMAYFANAEGGISNLWWFGTIVAIGLGAGSTAGDDVVSIFVEGIKGYVQTMILLAIFALVGGLVHVLVVKMSTPDPAQIALGVLTFVVSGLLTNMMLSYLRKANI